MQRRIIDKRNKEKFLVDDAYLNGYAKLCGINATGVYMVMCRHADKNQECFPSKKLIAEKLSISERSVYSAIKTLEVHRIIRVEQQGRKPDGTFQNLTYILQDKSQWIKPSANRTVGKKRHQPSANGAITVGNSCRIRKHIYKDTHNKEVAEQSSASLNPLLDKFKDINPSYKQLFSNKTQRAALQRLVEQHGQKKIEQVLKVLPKTNTMKYAPTITTPSQLENKLGDLIAFVQKERAQPNLIKL